MRVNPVLPALLLVVSGPAFAQGPVAPTKYVSKADYFSIDFVGEPKVQEITYPDEYRINLPARVYTADAGRNRYKVLATNNGFHGRGFAAMNATAGDKVRKGYSPYLDGFGHAAYNSLDAMAAAIDDETAAIIVEPIQGEGGVHVPDDDYLPGLRALCDEHDLLLISDEVWTGCGRTGNWFAYQHTDIKPDIMTLGKAIGCGLPVSVMCAALYSASDRLPSRMLKCTVDAKVTSHAASVDASAGACMRKKKSDSRHRPSAATSTTAPLNSSSAATTSSPTIGITRSPHRAAGTWPSPAN